MAFGGYYRDALLVSRTNQLVLQAINKRKLASDPVVKPNWAFYIVPVGMIRPIRMIEPVRLTDLVQGKGKFVFLRPRHI